MNIVISSLESSADALNKFASMTFKFGIAIGGSCILLYSLRIGHFPKGLSLGDGLLFLLTAGCFGAVYALFVGSLVSLGSCLSLITKPLLSAALWLVEKVTNKKTTLVYEIAQFHWSSLFFAGLALIMIWKFGKNDLWIYGQLLALSIMLHMIYSAAIGASQKYRDAEKLHSMVIEIPGKTQASDAASKEKSVHILGYVLVVLAPLLMGGVTGQLVDGAMRLAQVRIEQPTLYISSPYSSLIPVDLIANKKYSPEGHKAYEGMTVLFNGFGSTTVIAFRDGNQYRQLEIPNDHIIVEKMATPHK